jgi:hypothetical protein
MNRKNDPYRDKKLYHKAKLFGPDGRVSALCFNDWMRAIPRVRGVTWTTDHNAVNCKKCLRRMALESQHGIGEK